MSTDNTIIKTELFPENPRESARRIIESCRYPLILGSNGRILQNTPSCQYWLWKGSSYINLTEKEIGTILRNHIEDCCYVSEKIKKTKKNKDEPQMDSQQKEVEKEKPKQLPFLIDDSKMKKIDKEMQILCSVDQDPLEGSSWLFSNGERMPKAGDIISTKNWLVNAQKFCETGNPFPEKDVKEGCLMEHTSRFFSANNTGYDINPNDCGYTIDPKTGKLNPDLYPWLKPTRWLEFLKSVFQCEENDPVILSLQQFFGSTLVEDKRFEKGLWLRGEPRSGKGIIASVLQGLHGRKISEEESREEGKKDYQISTSSVSPSVLIDRFALMNLVGKKAVIIPEIRLEDMNGHDKNICIENLLQLISKDLVTVMIKGKASTLNVLLPCKIMVQTNDAPLVKDKTNAFISRFIHLKTKKSFLGNEDLNLLSDLYKEIPRIFWWALIGLKEARKNTKILQPPKELENIQNLKRHSSSVKEFMLDRCVIDNTLQVSKEVLAKQYKEYCEDYNLLDVHHDTFFRILKEVAPIDLIDKRTKDGRMIKGIALVPNEDDPRMNQKPYKED